MNRITEKFNFSIVSAETTTRLLSLKLANLSISTLRFFKAVLSKPLRTLFFSMDDIFSSEDGDNLFDLDYNPYARKRPLSSRLDSDEYDEAEDEETNREKLYLVPYRCVFLKIFSSPVWLPRKQEREGNVKLILSLKNEYLKRLYFSLSLFGSLE